MIHCFFFNVSLWLNILTWCLMLHFPKKKQICFEALFYFNLGINNLFWMCVRLSVCAAVGWWPAKIWRKQTLDEYQMDFDCDASVFIASFETLLLVNIDVAGQCLARIEFCRILYLDMPCSFFFIIIKMCYWKLCIGTTSHLFIAEVTFVYLRVYDIDLWLLKYLAPYSINSLIIIYYYLPWKNKKQNCLI